MPSEQEQVTEAQRAMLHDCAATRYGECYVRGQRRRTAAVLVRRGFLERLHSQGWHRITSAGRAVLHDATE